MADNVVVEDMVGTAGTRKVPAEEFPADTEDNNLADAAAVAGADTKKRFSVLKILILTQKGF